jgi:hypothetical protein
VVFVVGGVAGVGVGCGVAWLAAVTSRGIDG